MARVAGEGVPAFTSEELDKLMGGVLPLYAKLYGRPEVQVTAHQKRGLWHAIAREVPTMGVYNQQSTHSRKRWEDLRRWERKTCEAQLGKSSQRGKGAHRALTPLMRCILAVAYPDLDGRLKAAQQTQGASSGEGAVAPASGDAAAHGSTEAESSDAKGTSGMEGEGSTTGEAATTGGSDSDTSSVGSSLAVADPSGLRDLTLSSSSALSVVEVYGKEQEWHDLKLSLLRRVV
ncbi:hypothetical protein NDU88_005488 [Pleurodeles waltl]|uniref:Myb/SANT-like DNA-binding domain-containing protein n=1 Tax=Pleurodeles waltl TaxID=8319 RepID=A0AAV7TVN3_PLEWA|nr:hypothetical protein NDU88_005488 [Pleurodeles waltl]